jgi:hypothetical protein
MPAKMLVRKKIAACQQHFPELGIAIFHDLNKMSITEYCKRLLSMYRFINKTFQIDKQSCLTV